MVCDPDVDKAGPGVTLRDMDRDGVPEIIVRWVIAHGDGTVIQRARDTPGTGGAYNTLADVDGDGELELVGGNGVYEIDGTPVWERVVDGARIMMRCLSVDRTVIGIENNKPDAIEAMTRAVGDDPAITRRAFATRTLP